MGPMSKQECYHRRETVTLLQAILFIPTEQTLEMISPQVFQSTRYYLSEDSKTH